MAGKKLDRTRSTAALQTVKESPVIAAVALAPAVIVFVLVGAFVGWGWAIALLIVLGIVAVVGGKFVS